MAVVFASFGFNIPHLYPECNQLYHTDPPGRSDCFTCHKQNVQLIGPSFAAIAKKYRNTPANTENLAMKIIKGGTGAWGKVPMPPHPTLTKKDAAEKAKYVLSGKW